MKLNNNRIIKELVNNVHELKQFVQEQKAVKLALKSIVKELADNLTGLALQHSEFMKEQRELNQKISKFMIDSERRFRVFFARLVKLEHNHRK